MIFSVVYFTGEKKYNKAIMAQFDVNANDESSAEVKFYKNCEKNKFFKHPSILFIVENPKIIDFINSNAEVVYVISCNNSFVKIGHTTNFLQRYNTLQTANPYPLKVEYVLYVGHGYGKKVEQAFHQDLFKYRKIREWFDIDVLKEEKFENRVFRILDGAIYV